MKRIPKTFQLLGHTITVRIVSKRDWEALADMEDWIEEDDQAAWFDEDHVILIKRGSRSAMFHRFTHELTHAILDMMNHDLSYNEQFVDNFAGLLAQAMDTAK